MPVLTHTWTLEVLRHAHPEVKAAGWTWELWNNGETPTATCGPLYVTVLADGRLMAASGDTGNRIRPPADITLSVIQADKGLDSRGQPVVIAGKPKTLDDARRSVGVLRELAARSLAALGEFATEASELVSDGKAVDLARLDSLAKWARHDAGRLAECVRFIARLETE